MTAHPVFNGATTDQYQYLFCFGSTKLNIQVSNAVILLGFGTGGGPDAMWDTTDEPYLPIIGSIARQFDAIRFKSATLGVPAQAILIPIVA